MRHIYFKINADNISIHLSIHYLIWDADFFLSFQVLYDEYE